MYPSSRDCIQKIQDYTRLVWSDIRSSSGTHGCFLKTYERNESSRVYYKLSNFDSYRGFFGHECVNELVASRLLNVLGFEHLNYRLIHSKVLIDGKEHETWMCAARNFRKRGERKLALDVFFDLESLPGESPLALCARMGWMEQIHQMILTDFLVANRDRHGANIEVLRSPQGEYRLAPLFDHGVSLLFSTYGDEAAIREFDVMKDIPVNNYIGSRSLFRNLDLLPKNLKVNPPSAADFDYIFRGVDKAVSPALAAKMREMLERRWKHYEEIRNRQPV